MALMKSGLMMEEYISDVGGKTFSNVPVRFGANIPDSLLEQMGYVESESGCGIPLRFKRRAFIVTMADGAVHRLPIGNPDDIPDKAAALNELGDVICVGIDGEQWGSIPANIVDIEYTTANKIISAERKFVNYQGDYTSDVTGTSSKIIIRVEDTNEDLKNCSVSKLDGATQTEASCGTGKGFKPRHFLIKGKGGSAGSSSNYSRKAVVSTLSGAESASNLGDCSQCLGYKGESMNNVELLLAD